MISDDADARLIGTVRVPEIRPGIAKGCVWVVCHDRSLCLDSGTQTVAKCFAAIKEDGEHHQICVDVTGD